LNGQAIITSRLSLDTVLKTDFEMVVYTIHIYIR
jgi:hypothetical protein